MKGTNGGRRPQRTEAWWVAMAASLLVLLTGVLAFYMADPIDFDGPGVLGALAFGFPLHLLIVTLVAAVFAALAWRRRAFAAAAVCGLVVGVTAYMALWPSIAMLHRARQEHVSLSLGTYLANALSLNAGRPQQARSVVYRTGADGTTLALDVWLSNAGGVPLHPAVVRVHGGGWTTGTRGEGQEWDQWLNELGYSVFDVEYRMAPAVRWTDEVGDIKCALGWVATHAGEYHLDPSRISIMGHSAGGNLAMLAAYSAGDPQLPPSCDVPAVPARCVINLYGPADLTLLYGTGGSLGYIQHVLTQYIGGPPEEFPDRYRALSPLSHVGAKTPPTIMLLGESDRIVPTTQAQILNQALTRAGVAHETDLLPGNDHGFDVNWGGFGTQFARDKIKAFLQRHG